jgi:hypothetical protein
MRHLRPFDLSDEGWERLGSGKCPLCKGEGVYESPPGASVGILFCSTRGGRSLAACPDPCCPKWADVTGFLDHKSNRSFSGKCPDGHVLTFEVVS